MYEKLKMYADSFLNMGVPGFDLLIYKDGSECFRYSGGYSDLENKIPIKGNERYNIYSCSKPITCSAALQLYEKGLFKLSDKLCEYMPEFENMTVRVGDEIVKADHYITVDNLFTMTAGFTYDLGTENMKRCRTETYGKCPTREAMRYLAKDPLSFQPGEKWQYSLCHDVLAALVEVLSGEKFEDYVKKNIFDKLGMKHSTFMLPENELDTIACHYRFNNGTGKAENCGKNIQTFKIGSEYASGGAGCISTVDDYIKFLEALRVGDVILAKETIDLMATGRLTPSQMATYNQGGYDYGLGVRCPLQEGADYIRTDFGWGGAAGAYLAVNRKLNYTLFYAQHLMNSPNQTIRRGVSDLFAETLR